VIDPELVGEGFASWVQSGTWQSSYVEFVVTFFAEFEEATGENALEVLSDLPEDFSLEAFSVCLEDFATQKFEREGGARETPVDAFLREKGDEYSDEARSFMLALRDSKPGLFEFVEMADGGGCFLRNLLEPSVDLVRVSNPPVEIEPEAGDVIFARILKFDTENLLSNSYLDMSEESREEIVEILEETVKERLKDVPKMIRKDPTQLRAARAAVLKELASIATAFWLDDLIRVLDDADMSRYVYEIKSSETDVAALLDGVFTRQAEPPNSWAVADGENLVAAITIQQGLLLFVTPEESAVLRLDARLKELLGDRIGEGSFVDPDAPEGD
jgi:hypothetical protein